MPLNDPNLRPGETEEQRRQRLAKAAKWAKISADSRALAQRSSYASRILRLAFLAVCGAVLTGIGIQDFSKPGELSNPQGFGNQHFGPHGNAFCETFFGLIMLALAVFFLLRYIRRVRTLPPLGTPKA